MKTVLQNLRGNRIAAKSRLRPISPFSYVGQGHKKRKRGPECIAAKGPRDRNNYISSANLKADLLLVKTCPYLPYCFTAVQEAV